MQDMIQTIKALSDSNRVRILKMLEIRPLCVCELREVLDLATSTVSKHLSVLRDAGFLLDEKEGKWVNYYLNRKNENDYVNQLMPLLKSWLPDDETIKNDALKVRKVDRNIICGL
jgi:ArsR family transcriptional regulator